MTTIAELLIGTIFVGAITVPLWSLFQLKRFLAETPAIKDVGCLDRFKRIVRVQMYVTLGYMAVFIIGIFAGSVLIVLHHGTQGLIVVLSLNAVIFGLGMYHRQIEARTRNLESAPELMDEYQRIGRTWGKKALPDF